MNVAAVVLLAGGILFTCAGNILTMLTLARLTTVSRTTRIFMTNLALADLLVGLFTILRLLYEIDMTGVFGGRVMCIIRFTLLVAIYTTSSTTLAVIAVERYLATVKSALSSISMTNRRAVYITVATWVHGVGVAAPIGFIYTASDTCHFYNILPAPYWHFIAGQGALVTIILLAAYFKIIKAMRRQQQLMPTGHHHKVKIINTCFLIVCLFTAFHLPIFVLIELSIVLEESALLSPTFQHLEYAAPAFVLFNSAINPVVYFFKVPTFKTLLKSLLCRCCPVNKVEDIGNRAEAGVP